MNLLLLRPKKYAPGDGYGNFGPEGNRLVKLAKSDFDYNTRIVEIDAQKMDATAPIAEKAAVTAQRRKDVIAAIHAANEDMGELGVLVFASHGWSRGMQLGFDVNTANQLAECVYQSCREDIKISLNECSTGSGGIGGDGGFADVLRDKLCEAGAVDNVVDGHTSVGDAFKNPNLRRFTGDGHPHGAAGGAYLIAPTSPLFKYWVKLMRTNLRYVTWHFEAYALAQFCIDAKAGKKPPAWMMKNLG